MKLRENQDPNTPKARKFRAKPPGEKKSSSLGRNPQIWGEIFKSGNKGQGQAGAKLEPSVLEQGIFGMGERLQPLCWALKMVKIPKNPSQGLWSWCCRKGEFLPCQVQQEQLWSGVNLN